MVYLHRKYKLNLTMESTHEKDDNDFVVINPCPGCRTRHSIYPPASEYISTMFNPCARGDYQKSFFDCTICNQRNTFYWYKGHREDRILLSV